jgi:major membrane immunogen (membrane-anchored lipoprotein)
MHKFKIITHFLEEDEYCTGDYCSVTIEDQKGNIVKSYGDYYHDKGREKAEGFIEGVKFALQENVELEYISINDSEE